MNNFNVIYRMLQALERAMDYDDLDPEAFAAERFGISENRRNALLVMMQEEGYVRGISVIRDIGGEHIIFDKMRITEKGLEYLSENSMMRRAADAPKGIIDAMH